ncbi:hypothetical protein GGI26_000830 [Coemansia sp. RSA 1358]|nr:hypothetical protein GGI26_000830 [Coemansia sp. RSA 1358]
MGVEAVFLHDHTNESLYLKRPDLDCMVFDKLCRCWCNQGREDATEQNTLADNTAYRSTAGSLRYLALVACSGVAYAASTPATISKKPTEAHICHRIGCVPSHTASHSIVH